jgi:hypothetical protein
MRGQQSLFENVFVAVPELTVSRQGRSEELIKERNECLVSRYYYYGKFTDKRYDAIMNDLKKEFFIETMTIQERIQENFEILAELKKQQPSKNHFKDKWPHLVW